MRFTKYKVELVKEASCNYGGSDIKINNPNVIYKLMTEVYRLDVQAEEVLYCLCLDTKNKVIGVHEVSRGTINSSLVNPREVFKRALVNNANKIILIHNHPSGVVDPSKDDDNVTSRIKKGGELLGVELIDHVIIGENRYYSYKENLKL